MKYLAVLSQLLLVGTIGCSDGESDVFPEVEINQACFSGDFVKKVKNQKGIIYYNPNEQRFAVYVTIPGTYDSQDIGFFCDNLDTLKKDNLSITFTGTYHPYLEGRTAPIGGQQYYYLEIQKFKIINQ